ncbi:hypothetical protein [Escherichia phage ZCEC11]|nr:hypothetical protein [Escherichia phage ZCEC11]
MTMMKMTSRASPRNPSAAMTTTMRKMKNLANAASPAMTKMRTKTTKTKHHVNVVAVKGKAHYSSPLNAGFLIGQRKMRIKASEVKVGMQVWSKLLGEYFTVAEIRNNGEEIALSDGIFSMIGSADAVVRIKQ